MTPIEAKSIFKTQIEAALGTFIYVVRGYDVNNNSNEDHALANAYGLDVGKLSQNDRIVIKNEVLDNVAKELRHYQLYDYVGMFPRVKPANNTGHALTNRLVPVFQASTRLMINQYYLNDPTMPACAHTLKPKVA